MAIRIALNAVSILVRILSKRTFGSTNSLSHEQVLVGDLVQVLFRSRCWAIRLTLSHDEFVSGIGADHTIDIQGAVAYLTRRMTTDASNLDVVDLFCFQVREISVVVSDSS